MVKQNDGSQTFSCMNCGAPYTVYPPQSGYKSARLEPCTEGCDKKMNIICKQCSNESKLYWCTGHFHAVIASRSISDDLDQSFY